MDSTSNCLHLNTLKLKDTLLKLTHPTIFKNILTWENVPSTINQMVETYGDICLEFRAVCKSTENIAWEGDAPHVKTTISQFAEWLSCDKFSKSSANLLSSYGQNDYWLYSSYNYLNTIFPKDSEILKAVNWDMFGLSENIGTQSAFWMGSEGSYTPCHFDSYGCNIVAQICGRKKWILFPPEDTFALYPTRIPYEESSVFSSVNFLKPDVIKHPLFKKSHPHVAVLEPGEILFVPKHWWHFVISLDASVSINTWIKLNSDTESQLDEAVTKALMTSLIHSFEPAGKSWLNPNEELVLPEETVEYIIHTLSKISEERNISETQFDAYSAEKVLKRNNQSDVHSNSQPETKLLSDTNIKKIDSIAFDKCFNVPDSLTTSLSSSKNVTVESIMSCFVHPDVISLISKKL